MATEKAYAMKITLSGISVHFIAIIKVMLGELLKPLIHQTKDWNTDDEAKEYCRKAEKRGSIVVSDCLYRYDGEVEPVFMQGVLNDPDLKPYWGGE